MGSIFKKIGTGVATAVGGPVAGAITGAGLGALGSDSPMDAISGGLQGLTAGENYSPTNTVGQNFNSVLGTGTTAGNAAFGGQVLQGLMQSPQYEPVNILDPFRLS